MICSDDVQQLVEEQAQTIGRVWPLHSFVTANPLAGLEDREFHEAVQFANRVLGGNGYPSGEVFEQAWMNGAVDGEILAERLDDVDLVDAPEASFELLGSGEVERNSSDPESWQHLENILADWLAAFLAESGAEWSMPERERGFYGAVRGMVPHDPDVPGMSKPSTWPEEPMEVLRAKLADVPEDRRSAVVRQHLAALPGWVGFIRRRLRDEGPWQQEYPITLEGYLAVRLLVAEHLDAPIAPNSCSEASEAAGASRTDARLIQQAWLEAWEETYRTGLLDALADEQAENRGETERPDAQLVFCIDTRSEVIRRHIESQGNYRTHGYAGFFGIPMRYNGYDSEVDVDACPPIVDPAHRIEAEFDGDGAEERRERNFWTNLWEAGEHVIKALRSNPATAFSFVESAGPMYGGLLAGRTIWPAALRDVSENASDQVPDDYEFCEPTLEGDDREAPGDLPVGMELDEQVEYAASAFELMGWRTFGRLVVFVGHASETANNPFDASLDCGACAGNPGGPSARVLATICNRDAVREKLEERGFDIPEDTHFLAGQHNTTTDEIELYAADVPDTHREDLAELREDLAAAREGAAAERTDTMRNDPGDAVRETERRAADWSETRPEWGLAGNAAFVIGPGQWTSELNLDGRVFLHSYDWRMDADGEALEAIMTGPMVVTQWINMQYYFATVDPEVYGSDTKVTQNPVGNIGVFQGNGGDLEPGLPLQSVRSADDTVYHEPIRLMTVIRSPVERVDQVIANHEQVAQILDNQWLDLAVLDPRRGDDPFRYESDGEWSSSWRNEETSERETPSQKRRAPEPVMAE